MLRTSALCQSEHCSTVKTGTTLGQNHTSKHKMSLFFHFNHSFNLSEQCALHLKWAIFSLRLLYPHFRQGTPTHRASVHQYTWKNWAIRSPTSSKQCMLFHLSALGLAQTKQHASAKYVLLWNLMHSTKFSAFFLYSVWIIIWFRMQFGVNKHE